MSALRRLCGVSLERDGAIAAQPARKKQNVKVAKAGIGPGHSIGGTDPAHHDPASDPLLCRAHPALIDMHNILFVCTGNLYRSPLAAAFFSRKLQADGFADSWIVESAGTWTTAGRHIPPNFLKAARRFGIELNDHRTRLVDEKLLAVYDLIVVMEKGHREALRFEFPSSQGRIRLLSELADQLEYDIADPAGSTLAANDIINKMSGLIDRAYPNICQLLRSREMH